MTIEDAKKVIGPESKTKDILMIGEKYRMVPSATELEARRIAARIMKYAIDKAPRIEYGQGGERTAYCKVCEADITDGFGEWEYCPFCGQAVKFPEEE